MKLVILGANGHTGAHVVRLALDQGFHVTALVRSDSKRPAYHHDRLTVVIGDPSDPKVLARIFHGQDAVISTLGGRRPSKRAMAIYPASADAIVAAAWETGLTKVLVTSSALLFPPRRWIDRALRAVVGNVVQSATRMEATLHRANLDVTIARCGFLNNSDATAYRAAENALPIDGSSISRRSLAQFLVDRVQANWSGYNVIGVAGPDRPGT